MSGDVRVLIDKIRKSQQQERNIATSMGGRVTPGSGNQCGANRKGDVQVDGWLVEAKRTESKKGNYTLRLSDWRKVECQAIRQEKEPVMVIEIMGRQLAVIDYETFLGFRNSNC